jgi:arylsulfatase A-like enzyme
LNIIQIVSDTFRRDSLGCYGENWVNTKHLDDFAKKSLVFDKAYIASYPTIPNRRDMFTGRYAFTYSKWHFQGNEPNLPRSEIILSEILRQSGYTTMLIGDTYHLFRDGHYFDRGFDGWWWIRGQEQDRNITAPAMKLEEKKNVLKRMGIPYLPWGGLQYLNNISNRRCESDYFTAQTMTAATKWLELNYDQHKKFFLHIDTFDPHEPWDPPRWYVDMYDSDWRKEEINETMYDSQFKRLAAHMQFDKVDYLKALYAGEVTMVDRWVGMLLQKIEDLGLFENTLVIFTTDHGTHLGEHGYIGKRPCIYEEVGHIPLIMRLPDSKGNICGHCEALVQPPDIMPTILELAGLNKPQTVQGKSLIPLIQGKENDLREFAVSSQSLLPKDLPEVTYRMTVTSKEWSLILVRSDAPMIDDEGRKIEPELYNLLNDPKQKNNLYEDKHEIADKLCYKAIHFLRTLKTKKAILQYWVKK